MKRILLLSLIFISLIPTLSHLHIVEKDFLEILGSADGILKNLGYCFLELKNYVGIEKLTGITARPPLIPMILRISFAVFGHNLLAVYLVYMFPRLLIAFALYASALFFFPALVAYLVATLPFFFPYFETYALATLKADVFVAAFSLISVYFALRWKRKQKLKDLFYTSLFLSFNVLSKETAIAFSGTLVFLILLKILKDSKKKSKELFLLLFPPLMLVGPFVLFSLLTTERIFPSIFATARSSTSFAQNIQTYLLSTIYYAGIDFSLSKIIALTSFMRLGLLLTGIFAIFKKKHFELLLPPLAVLVAISFIDIRVVQGDIVGNREILHRIAFVVPFISLYFAFGISAFVDIFLRTYNTNKKTLVAFALFFFLQLNFIQQYFSATFALDYTEKEFYVNAQTVFLDQTQIPMSEFKQKDGLCIISHVPAEKFLTDHYRQFKTSAFPKFYKELLITAWILPFGVIVVFRKQLNK